MDLLFISLRSQIFDMDSCVNESIIKESSSKEENTNGRSTKPTENNSENEKLLAQGRRPFDIVLKGGTPWGFALNGGGASGVPLHISKIAAGGKASESALVEGDYVLGVNNVPCSEVGPALDIVDTASNTLIITVLRGHWDSTSPGVKKQLSHQRSLVLGGKPRSSKRHSDDSVVYSSSKSRQLAARGMRQYKRRGNSFNVGKQNSPQSYSKNSSDRFNPPVPGLSATSDPSQPIALNSDISRGHYDAHASPPRQTDIVASMNRGRSEGPITHSSVIYQQQQNQQLLSTKSSPNLANTDLPYSQSGSHVNPETAPDQRQLTKSSPNLLSDVKYEQRHLDNNFNMKHSGYGSTDGRNYSIDAYASEFSPSRQNSRRSLPAHSLQRYQPDYENISHLGTAPIGSEKISEIDDIDEVTGRDSNPQSPDVHEYDPLRGAGLPTRDPASLKGIKVNQNHEKYPSWPVTKPNGATEQTQPINSRALSMTDHTNTSTEFPKKQQLAYTPGLRPLAEKNSPTADRKADDGKGRNSSDPGFKSEFVYDRYGRVQRRKVGNTEGRFDDFYNNSKPGYPPPSMDPDGHNLGDKEYNVPSPPERDGKFIDQAELSHKLVNISGSEKTPIVGVSVTPKSGQEIYRQSNQLGTSRETAMRPSDLNVSVGNISSGRRTDTGTNPVGKGSPLSSVSQHDTRGGFQTEQIRQSLAYDQKKSSPQQTWQNRDHQSPLSSSQSQSSNPIQRLRPYSQKEQSSSPAIQKYRPSSQHDRLAHPSKSDSPKSPGGAESNKTYIVRSTPYYNTSTQTEMGPYAIKVSDLSVAASKQKNAETQVGGLSTQTSPKTPKEQRILFEEKSTQARMSCDFEHSHQDTNKKLPPVNRGQSEDFFRYPPPALNSQTSPFRGIQSIQAKYATDELYDTNAKTENSKTVMSNLSDNASILRKLSEELYSQKLGLMSDKRMSSSSSQESPRLDSVSPATLQQPGLREAESYSSVVIHHEEKSGLFGGDDMSSTSSSADFRHDMSSVFSDSSSNYRNIDAVSSKGRNPVEPSYLSHKTKLHHNDPKVSSSTTALEHNQEASGLVAGPNSMLSSGFRPPSAWSSGKVSDQTILGAPRSNVSSSSKSFSSDSRSSNNTSVASNAESSSSSSSLVSMTSNLPGKLVTDVRNDKPRNDFLGSDSVFVGDDGKDGDDLLDYEFNRKPSMRKAYGIYDETERLISQSKVPTTAKSASERLTTPPCTVSAAVPTWSASRSSRYSESAGLGKIQEESDTLNDFINDPVRSVESGQTNVAVGKAAGRKSEKPEKYPWQNEAWLKNNVDIPTGSNLKRTTSEQICVSKPHGNTSLPFHDTNFKAFQKSSDLNAANFVASTSHNNENKNIPSSLSSEAAVAHSRTRSEDLSRLTTEQELTKFQQQELPRLYGRDSGLSSAASTSVKDLSSADTSLYEYIGGNRSDSVSDVIVKVNENLAKSAQRVDSIRRSNSSVSRNSSDYMDMSRDRNRKETDWSRLRSSGSLRYSPEHDHRSSRSSFASENLYEDISMFAPSTPRSSFAEGSDRMLEPGNSNASMDSGLVASPTYQNFPYQRRPPPLPPRSPSPDEKPPALPPRKYRENQQSVSFEKSVIAPAAMTAQTPPIPPVFASEKGGVTPLSKHMSDDNQVDKSRRDFKTLMTQWENNTPREDKYAAELRKQAKKFSNNQQHQQVNAMPAAYERTTTKISYSTTIKHEPMQPQEATSPLQSSVPSYHQSVPSIVSTYSLASSSDPGSSSPSSSSSPLSLDPASGFYSPSYKNNNTTVIPRQESGPPSSDNSPPTKITGSVNNISLTSVSNTGYGAPVMSSTVSASTVQSKISERTQPQDYSRNTSDALWNKPAPSVALDPRNKGSSGSQTNVRERRSSEHDILSDRGHNHQTSHHHANHATVAKDDDAATTSKWRSNRFAADRPIKPSQAKSGQMVEIVSVREGEFSQPSLDSLQGGEDTQGGGMSTDSEGFADESYIGHKNKSSRAIGTYKRSKSAAVLQSSTNNNYKLDGDTQSTPFQESTLGQQSWSSESVLSRTDVTEEEPLGAGREDKTGDSRTVAATEYLRDASQATPVRPVRSGHGRYSVGQLQTSAFLSSSSFTQNSHSPSSSTTVPSSLLSAKPALTEKFTSGLPQDSSRRSPPASLDGLYNDPARSSQRDKTKRVPGSTVSPHKPGDGFERGYMNNIPSSHYPTTVTNYSTSLSGGSNSWNPYNNSVTTSPLKQSSQDNNNSKAGNHVLPNDNAPNSFTQRDYRRRESAPVRPITYTSSLEGTLDIPQGNTVVTPRRRSDTNIDATQRSDQGSYGVSTSSHSRQPSQEELECDEKAKQLAQELPDKEQKLSEVLRLDANKKRMQYMDGLFSESVDATSPVDRSPFNQETRFSVKQRSPQHSADVPKNVSDTDKRSSLPKEYWMSSSKALLEMELRKNEETSKDLTKDINDTSTLVKHKEELLEKLHKKLVVLQEEKMSLQQEISDNTLLGQQVCQTVDARCQSASEREKLKAYIDDLEKIVRLLLNLSGQLARAENAVQALGPNADAKLKKLTIDKRERLFAKHEEAKYLKEDIDKRSEQLAGVLRDRLSEREFSDYTHFIKMKSKLMIDLQELDDKITLGEEQILELKKSIPDLGTS